MKTPRSLSILALVTLTALGTVGCGSDYEEPPTPPEGLTPSNCSDTVVNHHDPRQVARLCVENLKWDDDGQTLHYTYTMSVYQGEPDAFYYIVWDNLDGIQDEGIWDEKEQKWYGGAGVQAGMECVGSETRSSDRFLWNDIANMPAIKEGIKAERMTFRLKYQFLPPHKGGMNGGLPISVQLPLL